MGTKALPKGEYAVGTHIVSALPCGLSSLILFGDGTNAATLKVYDHAATATGDVKKQLAYGATTWAGVIVYTPSKADAFSNGVVIVLAGTNAKAYVSIE